MKVKKHSYQIYFSLVSLAVIYPFFYISQISPQGFWQMKIFLKQLWPSVSWISQVAVTTMLLISFALYIAYLFVKLVRKRSDKLYKCFFITILFIIFSWRPWYGIDSLDILLNYIIFAIPIVLFFEVIIFAIWNTQKKTN